MDRNRRGGGALIAIAALAALLCASWGGAPAAPWQFRLEIASVRLSISAGEAAVRNRAPLFEIGQVLLAWCRA